MPEVGITAARDIHDGFGLQMHIPRRRGQLSDAVEEEAKGSHRKEKKRSNKYIAVGVEEVSTKCLRETGIGQAGEGRNFANDGGSSQNDSR